MKIDLEYDGEFGPELQTVLPYAYYLHKNGLLGKTTGALDTKCLYYFSQHHEEKFRERCHRWPYDSVRKDLPNPDEHVVRLDTSKWIPPPYKAVYANDRFRWGKELLVIMNKFCVEWRKDPVNTFSLPVLERLVRLLKDRYQIIYCRPGAEDIIKDGNRMLRLDDLEILARFPEVVTIQDLKRDNLDLSFNTLQMKVFANCCRFISVQGGNSVLASYFGGVNIIYVKGGQELKRGDYHHFALYSGARICPCLSYTALLCCVRTVFGGKEPLPMDSDRIKAVVSTRFFIYDLRAAWLRILLGSMHKIRLGLVAFLLFVLKVLEKLGLSSGEDDSETS